MSEKCCRLNRSTQHFILKRKDGVYGDASRIFSRLQKGARFIGVFASLSEQGGTPTQRAAKTSEFETPAEISRKCCVDRLSRQPEAAIRPLKVPLPKRARFA